MVLAPCGGLLRLSGVRSQAVRPGGLFFRYRVRDEVIGALARHVGAAAGNHDLALWAAVLQHLRDDGDRIPFRGAVPPRLVASLEPYREDLAAVWCGATDEMDLAITDREGPGFEHR